MCALLSSQSGGLKTLRLWVRFIERVAGMLFEQGTSFHTLSWQKGVIMWGTHVSWGMLGQYILSMYNYILEASWYSLKRMGSSATCCLSVLGVPFAERLGQISIAKSRSSEAIQYADQVKYCNVFLNFLCVVIFLCLPRRPTEQKIPVILHLREIPQYFRWLCDMWSTDTFSQAYRILSEENTADGKWL